MTRYLKGYIVGLLKRGTISEKRMYEITITQTIETIIREKRKISHPTNRVFTRLVGYKSGIKVTDDFYELIPNFVPFILMRKPYEEETEYWSYSLWSVDEDGNNWRI